MWEDPIVDAVRKVRDAHAAQFDYDLQTIYRALKKEEADSGRKFVRLPPMRAETKEEPDTKSEPSAA
jgi:hypothetical protein